MTMKRANVLMFGLLYLALAAVPAFGDGPSRGLERNTDGWVAGVDSAPPNPGNLVFVASANGFSQVPAVLTPGRAWFRARINPAGPVIEYELRYQLEGPITDAFLFIGQPGANGGKAAALCVQEVPPGIPNGTPPCPAGTDDMVTGMIMPEDLLPSAALQGVNDIQRLIVAMASQITYVSVNSQHYPVHGEVRGQVAPLRTGNGGPGEIGSGDVSP